VDLATILGLACAFGSLALGCVMEGGDLLSFINIPAAVIVFGGSFGAVMVASPLEDILRMPIMLKHVLFARKADPVYCVGVLTGLARIARKEGVLALEDQLLDIKEPFIRRGIQLMVDGTDPDVTKHILEADMYAMGERHVRAAKVFSALGGLLPTLGVTGTVMGLVHMMASLDDPSSMGPAIAGAFMATLYGVGGANLVFTPMANKLRARSKEELFVAEIIAVGVEALQAGDSPIVLAERLKAFLPANIRDQAGEITPSGEGAGGGGGAGEFGEEAA